jgi:hypothetical protein
MNNPNVGDKIKFINFNGEGEMVSATGIVVRKGAMKIPMFNSYTVRTLSGENLKLCFHPGFKALCICD